MFMTAAKAKTYMIGVGLYIALELICKRDDRDFITDLQTSNKSRTRVLAYFSITL